MNTLHPHPQQSSDISQNIEKPDSAEQDQEQFLRMEILAKLNIAANSEARVRLFATLVDTYGLDVLVGLFPTLGDGASSLVSGVYLLAEAIHSGVKNPTSYLKIVGLQGADFFLGSVPVVGDVVDYFFKANKWSVSVFEKRTQKLIAQARKNGVPEQEIAKITARAETLPKLVNTAVKLLPKQKKPEVHSA